MIDTGSNLSVMSKRLADFLGVKIISENSNIRHVGGKSMSSNKVCSVKIDFGKFQIETVKFTIFDQLSDNLILAGNIFESVQIVYSYDQRPYEVKLNGHTFSAIKSTASVIRASSDYCTSRVTKMFRFASV